MENVTISAIYCDDIRPEMGGKFSYMGVYNSDLLLLEFPALIPKLCIQVIIRLPLETKIENLIIKVLRNDESLTEISLPEGQLQSMRTAFAEADLNLDGPLDRRELTCQLALQFPNLQLVEPGAIRLRVLLDGVEFRGNGLRVRLATPEEQARVNAV